MWCPINPRNEAAENRELLELFGCTALIFQASFAPLVEQIRDDLPALTTLVCLDGAGRRRARLDGVPRAAAARARVRPARSTTSP